MTTPSHPTLQKLLRLDTSPPDFGDQLCNILNGWEYTGCEWNLKGDDLAWLVDYIDKVRAALPSIAPILSRDRLSIFSHLPTLRSGSVCVSSEGYAAPTGYSRHPACLYLSV